MVYCSDGEEIKLSITGIRPVLPKLSPSVALGIRGHLQKTHVPPKSLVATNRHNFRTNGRTFFSVSIHLLMACTEDPVRSFRARMASVITLIVVMVVGFGRRGMMRKKRRCKLFVSRKIESGTGSRGRGNWTAGVQRHDCLSVRQQMSIVLTIIHAETVVRHSTSLSALRS